MHEEPPSWYLRVWLLLKAVVFVCWIAIFTIVGVNLLKQGAWFSAIVTLVILVGSVIRVRQWFGLAFSAPNRDSLPVRRPELPRTEARKGRTTSIQHQETRVIDRLVVLIVVLGLVTLAARYVYSLYQ